MMLMMKLYTVTCDDAATIAAADMAAVAARAERERELTRKPVSGTHAVNADTNGRRQRAGMAKIGRLWEK